MQAIVDSGQLSIFANAYWGHPAYKLPPEINLLAVAHYLEALDWQSHVTKIHTIFGGKNPHPNFVVGGVPMPIDLNSDTALNAERLSIIGDSIDKIIAFVDQVYLPDLLAIAPYYLEYAGVGEGLGNFLTWGEFPGVDHSDTSKFLVPRALILDRDLAGITEPDPRDMAKMKEFMTHSWYGYQAGDEVGLHPWEGETIFNYTGPTPPFEQLDVEAEVLLAQGAPLERHAGGGRSARARARDVRGRPRADGRARRLGARDAGGAHRGRVLDARPDGGSRDRDQGVRRPPADALRRPHGRDRGREDPDLQRRAVGAALLAERARRGSASWRRRAARSDTGS